MRSSLNCYGHYSTSNRACSRCIYMESCRYYGMTANLVKSRAKLASYEQIGQWLPEAADFDRIPGTEREEKPDITAMLARFFRYLLELDDYSIGVIGEVIAPADGNRRQCTVSQLGKLHGCSRQAMHRKLLHMIACHPELAVLLKDTMYKLSRGRQTFLRRRAQAAVNG